MNNLLLVIITVNKYKTVQMFGNICDGGWLLGQFFWAQFM